MSRGNREAVSGNIKLSMRDNYAEHGVDEYYKKVGATYRNPHFPGVRAYMCAILNVRSRWWQEEHGRIGLNRLSVFDMACGSGEATLAFMEWWKVGKSLNSPSNSASTAISAPRKKNTMPEPPPLSAELPTPQILAADPFTAEAFKARTSLNCSTWSFQDIANGTLSALLKHSPPSESTSSTEEGEEQYEKVIEMTICSFALHLIDSSSELFALLWELSLRSRWLILLAPHKKPEIKLGWGWIKWDTETWAECSISQSNGEFLQDRVHCRVYRSVNIL